MATKRTVKKAETMAAKAAAKATVKEAAVKPVVKEAAKEVTVKAAETKAETVKAEPAKEPVVKEAAKVTTAAKETEKPAANHCKESSGKESGCQEGSFCRCLCSVYGKGTTDKRNRCQC